MGNAASIIAYEGIVMLDKATWDTAFGMYASFKMDQPPQLKEASNPFKKFTQMRRGRVGTIFESVFNSTDESGIAFADEVMLKGWSDGTTGWKVPFWFKEDITGHPFLGVEKDTEYALVLVEMDDESAPINQKKRDRVEHGTKRTSVTTLSNYAAQLCREPAFMRYLGMVHGVKCLPSASEAERAHTAATWVRTRLGIESRAELDSNSAVAEHFHDYIRIPYSKWHAQQQ